MVTHSLGLTHVAAGAGAQATPDLRTGEAAVFIDWDNWHFAHFGLVKQTDPCARLYATLPDVDKALAIADRFGRITVGAAYGDWTKPDLKRAVNTLYRHRIEPVFVPGSDLATGVPVKNAADIGLAVAMIDTFYRFPQLDTFILGSGDGGLLPVVTFLRSRGRRVVVLSMSSALSRSLAEAADVVVRFDEPTSLDESDQQVPTPPMPVPFATVIEWMKTIVEEAGGACPLKDLGQQLRRRHELNARQHYGCGLKELLLRVPASSVLEVEEATDTVSLITPASTPPDVSVLPAA